MTEEKSEARAEALAVVKGTPNTLTIWVESMASCCDRVFDTSKVSLILSLSFSVKLVFGPWSKANWAWSMCCDKRLILWWCSRFARIPASRTCGRLMTYKSTVSRDWKYKRPGFSWLCSDPLETQKRLTIAIPVERAVVTATFTSRCSCCGRSDAKHSALISIHIRRWWGLSTWMCGSPHQADPEAPDSILFKVLIWLSRCIRLLVVLTIEAKKFPNPMNIPQITKTTKWMVLTLMDALRSALPSPANLANTSLEYQKARRIKQRLRIRDLQRTH